jgi:hypothetical protein
MSGIMSLRPGVRGGLREWPILPVLYSRNFPAAAKKTGADHAIRRAGL